MMVMIMHDHHDDSDRGDGGGDEGGQVHENVGGGQQYEGISPFH